MGQNVIRLALSALLLAIAVVSIDIGRKTYGKGEQQIELHSFSWGVNSSQFMRICVGHGVGAAPGSDTMVVDNFSLSFGAIKIESGVTVHETELQVPFGQYRCTDLSYQTLLAAGLTPESNSALQFFVTIRTRSPTSRVGATEAITVGAAQNIDVGTGEIKLNEPFRLGRQDR